MPKRPSKPKSDQNLAAADVVSRLTGDTTQNSTTPDPQKNPAAVALGRLGGRKGGKARAASLTPERRAELARSAATARWARDGND